MGLYIKGMDLTEIEKLVLTKNVQLIFCWTSDMKITAMTKAESDSGIVSYSKEFDIVEVPEPHGDLIDKKEVEEQVKVMQEVNGIDRGFMDIALSYAVAPTVIEAEE